MVRTGAVHVYYWRVVCSNIDTTYLYLLVSPFVSNCLSTYIYSLWSTVTLDTQMDRVTDMHKHTHAHTEE